MTFGALLAPALQLSSRLPQNAARRRFRNAGGSLQLQRNQRIRIDRRRDVIGVEARDPQRIEEHAGAGGAVDHRDRGARRFRLELRVAQQVAQASERLLQIHAPGDRIERAELGEHAVKFFERLVLDAAQRAIAGPPGRLPHRVKVLGPAARGHAAQAAHDRVHVARRDLQRRARSAPPSARSRTSSSDRAALAQPTIGERALRSLGLPADDERRAQQSPASVLVHSRAASCSTSSAASTIG